MESQLLNHARCGSTSVKTPAIKATIHILIFWYRSIAVVDAVYCIVEEHADQV